MGGVSPLREISPGPLCPTASELFRLQPTGRYVAVTLVLMFAGIVCGVAQAQTSSNNISPAYTIAPSVFKIGQTPDTLLTLTNTNANTTQQMLPGDQFTYTLGIPGASVIALCAAPLVNSQILRSSDFTLVLGPNPNQVTLTYIGVPQPFSALDTISIETTPNLW
jgi:hypothetical protein